MTTKAGAERLILMTQPDPVWEGMHKYFHWPVEPAECLLALDGLIERATLSPRVPEDVHRKFAIVCDIYRYGLFRYDLFAQAADQAFLIAETAFRRRFLEYYGNRVPFVTPDGQRHTVETASYEALDKAVNRRPLRPRAGPRWLLASKLSPQGPHEGFDASFMALLRWGFDEGLLPGRKGTHIAQMFQSRRNRAGHPTYRRVPPSGPASDLCTVAELINCLWGDPAPGGHLFPLPAPVHRVPMAIGKNRDGRSVWFDRAAGLPGWQSDDREAEVTLVLAADSDDVSLFQPGFEHTAYPCRLIWGPGTWEQAVDVLGRSNAEEDDVVWADRVFMIRTGTGLRASIGPLGSLFGVGPWVDGMESPRSIEAVRALPESQRQGSWFVVRADSPSDALGHVMGKGLGIDADLHKPRRFHRCSCGIDELAAGKDWQEALRMASGG